MAQSPRTNSTANDLTWINPCRPANRHAAKMQTKFERTHDNYNIVQRYMAKPHLIDGYKYDMRLFVLLTSLSPLRIYIFREGLVRLGYKTTDQKLDHILEELDRDPKDERVNFVEFMRPTALKYKEEEELQRDADTDRGTPAHRPARRAPPRAPRCTRAPAHPRCRRRSGWPARG